MPHLREEPRGKETDTLDAALRSGAAHSAIPSPSIAAVSLAENSLRSRPPLLAPVSRVRRSFPAPACARPAGRRPARGPRFAASNRFAPRKKSLAPTARSSRPVGGPRARFFAAGCALFGGRSVRSLLASLAVRALRGPLAEKPPPHGSRWWPCSLVRPSSSCAAPPRRSARGVLRRNSLCSLPLRSVRSVAPRWGAPLRRGPALPALALLWVRRSARRAVRRRSIRRASAAGAEPRRPKAKAPARAAPGLGGGASLAADTKHGVRCPIPLDTTAPTLL
ncbi:MAG TPA: hypothetical protein VJN21_04390 [Candidatus Acidoferrales bacterium]|nr:hypothetical protein [Candidatus Acidoferrales bacterium]